MIWTTLDRLDRCRALSRAFSQAADWIAAGSWRGAPDGRIEIAGGGLYALLMSYDTKAASDCAYEYHRRYADIQILLSGSEYVDVRPAEALPEKTPYDEAKDIGFLLDGGPGGEVRLGLAPGFAAVFFPEDAHKPCLAVGSPARVRKLVVKVAL